MDLKWLEDFVALAEAGSFSRSAHDRNVTQPAFSRRIRSLEDWLGISLVDRNTYPVSLTQAGRQFYDTARQVISVLHSERDAFKTDASEKSIIRFAAPHSLASHCFPDLLEKFELKLGELRIRLTADNLHACADALTRGAADFLLAFHHDGIPLGLEADRFQYRVLSHERLVPVVRPRIAFEHAQVLAGPGPIIAPLLLYPSESYLGLAVEHLFSVHHAVPCHVVYENALSDALKTMAMTGRGVAWLLKRTVSAEISAGQLVVAGDESWQVPLEMRIYRCITNKKPSVDRVWRASEDFEAGPCRNDMRSANSALACLVS